MKAIIYSFCLVLLCGFKVTAQTPTKNKKLIGGDVINPTVKKDLGQLTLKPQLKGYVDLHTHLMSYLGFGRKAMHGVPDVGSIIPAGTRDCNPTARRATSVADALGNCNATHGGYGAFDNTCGDYLRAGIINYALDGDFKYKVSFDRNPHGDHEHAGYPEMKYWPHQSSILHQQMWWEWIKRAYDGGLRVMVTLTVNSELLAELINGDKPYDDKTVADVQIDETISFVNRHKDFMEIAYSPADVRRIVGSNKLAVIMGMEVDKIGNFGKPGIVTNATTVKAEIQRLYRKGIRYVFPIHLVDNSFGGTAVYEMLFNFANKHANGYHFKVKTSTDPTVKYRANITDGPIGFENGLILGAYGFLEGLGGLPAPCADGLNCLPGTIKCCGSYRSVLNMLRPSPELDIYKTIRGGHVNAIGLSALGDIAINEMMKLGMIIDIDHMSESAMTKVIETAEALPVKYPLVLGHNGIRGDNGNERNAPLRLVQRVAALGGMFGLGTASATPDEFARNYRAVWNAMGKKAVGIGTDVNGFEPLPKHLKATDNRTSQNFYTNFFAQTSIKTKSGIMGSTRKWDYITEGGVSHYGLMPEFLFDVKTSAGGADVVDNLMQSAEHFAEMWEKCVAASKGITNAPAGGTYTYTLANTATLCPSKHVGGDLDFGGNGPRVTGRAELKISPDGTSIQAVISFNAKETVSDWSEVSGTWTVTVGEPAPAGMKYTRINSPTISTFDRVLSGGGRNEAFEGCDGGEHIITPASGPIATLVVVGDTGGNDISTDDNCNCDTRIVRIEWKPLSVTLARR